MFTMALFARILDRLRRRWRLRRDDALGDEAMPAGPLAETGSIARARRLAVARDVAGPRAGHARRRGLSLTLDFDKTRPSRVRLS